jgi:hypothetical protein
MAVATPARRHPERDYSGQPFGRPRGHALKALRVRVLGGGLGDSSTVLYGQDSIYPLLMTKGLAVYPGYVAGTYTNYAAVVADFPGARYVGIAPWIAPTDCLDIEPGDAVPGDAPAFFRQSTHPNLNKPLFYTSAGDVQAVINALSSAGIARSSYYIWSAHWIGAHICAPVTCGYPAADATQYASSNVDYDAWNSYVFKGAAPSPYPVLALTNPYTKDSGSTGPVHTLQGRLNVWRPYAGNYASLGAPDGVFGPATDTAVRAFQTYKFGVGPGVDGVVGPVTWAALNAAPPKSVFGPPTAVQCTPGDTTVNVTHCSPPVTTPGPVDHYEISVFTGSYPSASTLVPTYPRYMKASPQQFGGLGNILSGTHMTLRAVAYTADGQSSQYTDVNFVMP